MSAAPTLDPVLVDFMAAPSGRELEAARIVLLRDQAGPVIEATLRRRSRGPHTSVEDFEDVSSAALERVVRALQALRASRGTAVISRFDAYCAACARTAWLDFQRARAPERVRLMHQLRYLLEGPSADRRFVWREDAAGEGMAALAGAEDAATPETLARLQSAPAATIQDWLGAQTDPANLPLATLLERVLRQAEGALPFELLLEAVAAARKVTDQPSALAWAREEPADATFTPRESAEWRDHLRWLWTALGRLSLRQRTAFLLHSLVSADFEAEGIASLRQMAALLEIPAEEFVRLWAEIPLEDRRIAARLGLERQQIINLRRIARDHLGRAWREAISTAG